jgi:enterochelin esterase-like enzyme
VTALATRRAVLSGTVAVLTGCRNRERAAARADVPSARADDAPLDAVRDAAPEREPDRASPPGGALYLEKEIEFEGSAIGPEKALAIVPRWGEPGERFPVLVALHGRGEAVRGMDVGARGWMQDYGLGKTIARLRSPPLTRDDLKGFVDEARLARINASLAERPFRGLVIVCPWVPDLVNERDRTNLDAPLPFGRFVVETLLPRIWDETPSLRDAASTGIDGVSLGGRVSLVVGLAHASSFGAVAALQPAIQENEPPALARRAKEAVGDARRLKLRIVTSDQDYFRGAIAGLHVALKAEGIEHEHLVIPGPHDYAFNRGPGGVEMLLWHDRVLRGEPPL